jgi:hypothetical protein
MSYERFFKTLETASLPKEIIMPKNSFWGSRLTIIKGRGLHKVMKNNNVKHTPLTSTLKTAAA